MSLCFDNAHTIKPVYRASSSTIDTLIITRAHTSYPVGNSNKVKLPFAADTCVFSRNKASFLSAIVHAPTLRRGLLPCYGSVPPRGDKGRCPHHLILR